MIFLIFFIYKFKIDFLFLNNLIQYNFSFIFYKNLYISFIKNNFYLFNIWGNFDNKSKMKLKNKSI